MISIYLHYLARVGTDSANMRLLVFACNDALTEKDMGHVENDSVSDRNRSCVAVEERCNFMISLLLLPHVCISRIAE